MRIAIFGNFGVNNLGDDLILMGIKEQWKDHELIVFCGRPEQVGPQFGLQSYPFFPGGLRSTLKYLASPSYRQTLQKAHQALQSADLIIIGGGGILVDQHLTAVMLWNQQLKKILSSGRPYRFLGNSFELRRWWSKGIFEKYLAYAEKITVRDTASLAFIQSMGLRAELVDDFALTNLKSIPIRFQKKICLALCRSGVRTHELKILRRFIGQRRQEGYEIVGLAFQTIGDDDRKLYAKLDPNIPIYHGLENVLRELSSCQILVGMRFHSLLLALHLGIPIIALAYQQKVANLMADRGLSSQCIPIHNLDEQKLQELFLKLGEVR
jgi:polysaccharide pyruvyl transferase WcaK-like protein